MGQQEEPRTPGLERAEARGRSTISDLPADVELGGGVGVGVQGEESQGS